MRMFLPFLLLLLISANSYGQTIFTSGNIASTISAGANSASWNISGSSATATLTTDATRSDYLYVRGFDMSTLPNNAVVSSFFVFLSRVAGATVVDSAVRFVIGGNVYYAAGSNAASEPTTWPAAGGFASYIFNASALGGLTAAQLKDPSFGIAISGLRTANSSVLATVGTQMTIALSYNLVTPITLTDFSLRQNAEGHVLIGFATSNEEQVDELYVERSNNGKDFEKIFLLAPKGARNVYTRYNVTDKAPREGNNYYRITELDKNGRKHIYATRVIRIERNAKTFRSYFDGTAIVAGLKLGAGRYNLSISDMSGAVINRYVVAVSSTPVVQRLAGPYKPGLYIINCYGEGQVYTVRVPIGPIY